MKLQTTNYKLLTSQEGFTLIELLTVLIIMTLITSIAIANFRQADKAKRATIAMDDVIAAIRSAQNYILAGKNTNNLTQISGSYACRVPQYYAITFTYAGPAVLSALNNNTGACGSAPDQIETFDLPTATMIKSGGLVLDGTSASSSLQLVFYPPFGAIKAALDGSVTFNSFATANISVQTTDGSIIKTTTVDGVAGRIGQ